MCPPPWGVPQLFRDTFGFSPLSNTEERHTPTRGCTLNTLLATPGARLTGQVYTALTHPALPAQPPPSAQRAAAAIFPPRPPRRCHGGRCRGAAIAARSGPLPGDGDAAAMEAEGLPGALELAAGGGGAGLSPEKRAALGASLPLLKRDYRFEAVWFWGCVHGVHGTYYIAQGLGDDRAAPRSRLYRCPGEWERDGRPQPQKETVLGGDGEGLGVWRAPRGMGEPRCVVAGSLDCVEWSLLTPVAKEVGEQAERLKGRFQGDPSFQYEYAEVSAEDAERLLEDGTEVNTTKRFSSSFRYRCTPRAIQTAACV